MKLAHILLVREHSATVVSARFLKKKKKNAGREWIVGHSPQILASEETPPPPHTRTHDNAVLTNRTESHTRAHAHHLTIARTRAYTLTIQAGEKIIPVIAQARNRRPRGSSKFVVHVVWQKRKILPTTIATQITSCHAYARPRVTGMPCKCSVDRLLPAISVLHVWSDYGKLVGGQLIRIRLKIARK